MKRLIAVEVQTLEGAVDCFRCDFQRFDVSGTYGTCARKVGAPITCECPLLTSPADKALTEAIELLKEHRTHVMYKVTVDAAISKLEGMRE